MTLEVVDLKCDLSGHDLKLKFKFQVARFKYSKVMGKIKKYFFWFSDHAKKPAKKVKKTPADNDIAPTSSQAPKNFAPAPSLISSRAAENALVPGLISSLSSILRQSENHDANFWTLLTKSLELRPKMPKRLEPILKKILALSLTANEDEEKVVETFWAALVPNLEKRQKFPNFFLQLLVDLRQNEETRMTPIVAKIAALVGPVLGRFKAWPITKLWRELQRDAEEEVLKILNADFGKLIIFMGRSTLCSFIRLLFCSFFQMTRTQLVSHPSSPSTSNSCRISPLNQATAR